MHNNPKVIDKKISPVEFKAIMTGLKMFILLKDEDNIQIGDKIRLKECTEYNPTGRTELFEVTYVLRDAPEDGLISGFCIVGIRLSWTRK